MNNCTIESADYIRYQGFTDYNDPLMKKYYSQETINIISHKVTQLTLGVDQYNRRIVVPDHIIVGVMNSIYTTYTPNTGDIYTRYIVESGTSTESYIQNMIDQVIEVIVSDVRNNIEMEQNNAKLSIWTTVLGDFNEHELMPHSQVKVRNKRPTPFLFNMNY